jgi:hypothetical protein
LLRGSEMTIRAKRRHVLRQNPDVGMPMTKEKSDRSLIASNLKNSPNRSMVPTLPAQQALPSHAEKKRVPYQKIQSVKF